MREVDQADAADPAPRSAPLTTRSERCRGNSSQPEMASRIKKGGQKWPPGHENKMAASGRGKSIPPEMAHRTSKNKKAASGRGKSILPEMAHRTSKNKIAAKTNKLAVCGRVNSTRQKRHPADIKKIKWRPEMAPGR